jgi:peptidase M23-like protein
LLEVTTITRRIVLPVLAFLVWTPVAHAWSWPVQGPVVQPFAYDEAHPYAAGQHRGIDIGADAAGETVVAPSDGTVSFAGTVPTSGKSVTIETADGYSVTLTHLGSIVVAEGDAVAEGDVVGAIGPSGTAETDVPYVHLGIRVASDPNGYLDPLSLLPAPVAATAGSDNGSSATQPVANGGAAASPAPASQPAPAPTATTPAATSQAPPVRASSGSATRHVRERAQRSLHADARPQGSSRGSQLSQPAQPAQAAQVERPAQHRPRTPHHRVSEPVSVSRRPVVEAAAPPETAAPHGSVGPDAVHTAHPKTSIANDVRPRDPSSGELLALILNGAAALVALAAAFTAGRRRAQPKPISGAKVVPLPSPRLEQRRAA